MSGCAEASCLTLEQLQTGRSWVAALRKASRLVPLRCGGDSRVTLTAAAIYLPDSHTHTHQKEHTHTLAQGWRGASGLSHASLFFARWQRNRGETERNCQKNKKEKKQPDNAGKEGKGGCVSDSSQWQPPLELILL